MMRAIRIEGVSFKYRGSSEWALKDVDLEVEEGEYVLITGPSGCGKTTLCRCINGLIPHFYEGEYKGDVVLFEEIEVSKYEPYQLAPIVGMVFQDPESQLLMSSVEREIAFGLENLGIDRDEMRRRVEWALKLLGIEHLRNKAPYELSGGEQQKVAIASVIAMRPRILVLDEPTANLDPASSLDVINVLSDLKRKLNITIIIVEHRLNLLAPIVNRVVVMDKGRIIIDESPEEVFLRKVDMLEKIGVEVPKTCLVYRKLFEFENEEEMKPPFSPEDLVQVILNAKKVSNRS
ncbi:MAG: ABC transporter ATP-binding protein [Thermoprotei archaeon]|nr:MAG: ABC transporter ATP-binding protein [Thermoprotei archaeon]RLF20480.1 MAG: ABC transporter ATP-binding protein [Thermoprotei archaeon]